jgi:ATP-binding cassette subfamily B protein
MKRIFAAYKDLVSIIYAEAPVTVVITFVCTVISGLLTPFSVYINQNVFDGGLAVAMGEMTFSDYSIYLVMFVIVAILPDVISGIIFNYVQPRSILILRTAYKSRMLKKLKTMKYEHFENEMSAEIIDKAYNRAENAARHLWPMYVHWRGAALIASIGTFVYVFNIRWWLLFIILIPFILETYISSKTNYNIYAELETYWKKERKYSTLGWYLRSRDFTKELKAYGNYDYLIDVYKNRLNERNRDYERYYFKNIRKIMLGGNITKIASIINVIILLFLFVSGQMSVGLFIAMSGLMFGDIYGNLEAVAGFFKWSSFHINTYEYYDKFFELRSRRNLISLKALIFQLTVLFQFGFDQFLNQIEFLFRESPIIGRILLICFFHFDSPFT